MFIVNRLRNYLERQKSPIHEGKKRENMFWNGKNKNQMTVWVRFTIDSLKMGFSSLESGRIRL